VNDRELLDGRINPFMRSLGGPRAVYGHIAAFLIRSCTAQSAEYAISELLEKASPTVVSDINRSFTHNPLGAICPEIYGKDENGGVHAAVKQRFGGLLWHLSLYWKTA
jgi:hypothetical protein